MPALLFCEHNSGDKLRGERKYLRGCMHRLRVRLSLPEL